ncbi:MAG: hypothetical protein J3Q66DRAFT_416783 [Benniella sp.]|nr:MAG: hypothetical protein J3Q66DRAFT_416783 [Benniella sp.]
MASQKAKTVGSQRATPPVRGLPTVGSQAALQSASATAAAPAASGDVPPEHLIWALDQSRSKEHITFPNFVKRFGYKWITYPRNQDSAPYFRDPFKPLIEYIFKKVRGDDAHLPQVPASISYNHSEMFEVILSGIINTVSPSMTDLILSDTIMSNSELPTFTKEAHQEAVKGIVRDMLHALCPGIESDSLAVPHLEELQKWVWAQLAAIDGTPAAFRETRKKVLEVVSYLCSVITSKELEPSTSEDVFVSAWSHALNVFFDSNLVRGIPQSASKVARLATEKEHGVSTKHIGGRKVDISIRVEWKGAWDTEIAVFEFETEDADDVSCKRQQRKSVRLNAAILLVLETRGLDASEYFPVIAEGKGNAVNFYTLRRYEDIHGAGRTTKQTATLPGCSYGMKIWLKSDSLHLILALVDHTRHFARAVKETLSSSVSGLH